MFRIIAALAIVGIFMPTNPESIVGRPAPTIPRSKAAAKRVRPARLVAIVASRERNDATRRRRRSPRNSSPAQGRYDEGAEGNDRPERLPPGRTGRDQRPKAAPFMSDEPVTPRVECQRRAAGPIRRSACGATMRRKRSPPTSTRLVCRFGDHSYFFEPVNWFFHMSYLPCPGCGNIEKKASW